MQTMKVTSVLVSSTTLLTRIIISMTMDSIRSRECTMIQKSNSKHSTNSTMIVQLKTRRKKEISKKTRLHSKISMGTLLLIIIIRFHFNNCNSSSQLRHSISIRNLPFNISTKLIQVKATFHKVEWQMEEEARARMSVLINRDSVPSHKLQLIL